MFTGMGLNSLSTETPGLLLSISFCYDIYDTRIYCENSEDYDNIVSVIKERLKNKKFHDYYLAGKVSDIDSQW